MILSFADKETERIWHGQRSKKIPGQIQQTARRKLRMLNAVATALDLRSPPGNRLEVLRGDREGQFSIRINNQWRVCFRWEAGHAHDVEIVDYH